MTLLIELKAPRPRFARSINVERDAGGSAIDGYLPVGRAIDVVTRLARALDADDVECALSVTGPYGSGKSSLALFIDALLGPAHDPARKSAEELLDHAAPQVLATLRSARRRLRADRAGFIRASVTAQREPLASTVIRGLLGGVERFVPSSRQRRRLDEVRASLVEMQRRFTGAERLRPEVREIRDTIAELAKLAPVLLLIDEFGKNLEAFADSPSEADLFLLQELAEWSRGDDGMPLAIITLQHMAFDEYAEGVKGLQRREWAKVQGRFDDIPFIDTPAQTRSLIGAAFTEPCPPLSEAVAAWAKREAEALAAVGLNDLAADADVLARAWPLHPVALSLLPTLCERYGQNERTLFSFLAGPGSLGVAAFLAETEWSGGELPVVRLDRVYDYFIESAFTMVGVSTAASRWIEIDTRIRDAHGLTEPARRVLKAIGLLNLVSAGGPLRASEGILQLVASDGRPGTETAQAVTERLRELVEAGFVTYRDFADEWRIWHGSDFDLKASLDNARRRIAEEAPAAVVARVAPLPPVIAGRHSHETGTLRAFSCSWTDEAADLIDPLGSNDYPDGSVYRVLGAVPPTQAVTKGSHGKPVVFVTTDDSTPVVAAAVELAAIDEVLATSEALVKDWVARRELLERRFEAAAVLTSEIERAYGVGANGARWYWMDPDGERWIEVTGRTPSMVLSEVADAWYRKAPIIRNDLINRHELSSQAARARRMLMEAMLVGADQPGLGIEGFGPERTMYLSLLYEHGLHGESAGTWGFREPNQDSSIRPVWDRLIELLNDAVTGRLRVSDLYAEVAAPPYGLRGGVAPVLLLASLQVHAQEVAVYEHGTFRPVLTAEVCERLVRNPGNFELKHYVSRTGDRAALLTALADRLAVTAQCGPRNGRVGSVLAVVSRLVALVNRLPEYVKRTQNLSPDAIAVRQALLTATEPDELLFRDIPRVLGLEPIGSQSTDADEAIAAVVSRLAAAVNELEGAYQRTLDDLKRMLREELRAPIEGMRENLSVRAQELSGQVIEPKLARLLVALTAEIPGDDEWIEYVAMNVTGVAPSSWSDVDYQRYATLMHDLGATFRRVEALRAEVRSRGDGFDAIRVTVTRPDGAEAAKLVWVDEARRQAFRSVIKHALEHARPYANSDAEARDLLLGLLADHDLVETRDALVHSLRPPLATPSERVASSAVEGV